MTEGDSIKVLIYNYIKVYLLFMNQRPNSEYLVTKSSIANLPYFSGDMMKLIVIIKEGWSQQLVKLRHNPGRILRQALTLFIPPVLTCY